MIVFLTLEAVAAILAISFGPPLLIALIAESFFFTARRTGTRHARLREFYGYALTVIVSPVVGVVILNVVPTGLLRILSAQDLTIGGHPYLVMPAAFVAVAIVAPIVSVGVVALMPDEPVQPTGAAAPIDKREAARSGGGG